MKAVGLYRYLPVDHPEALLDLDVPVPPVTGRDLLVEVKAIAVNPVDCKMRAPKDQVEKTPKACSSGSGSRRPERTPGARC